LPLISANEEKSKQAGLFVPKKKEKKRKPQEEPVGRPYKKTKAERGSQLPKKKKAKGKKKVGGLSAGKRRKD
jgi:hypothetical protein